MDRQEALDNALGQIERAFGKGAVMKMNDHAAVSIGAVSTGILYGQQACPCSLWTSATTPGFSVPRSFSSRSMRAGFAVAMGTTCSSVRPQAIKVVIVDTRLKRAWPKNMCSLSGCSSGVPARP